jgi:zinc protease
MGRLDLLGMRLALTSFLPFLIGSLPTIGWAQAVSGDRVPAATDSSKSSGTMPDNNGSPPAAEEGQAAVPSPVLRTLANGLRVLVIPTRDDGIVAVQTWIDVGSGDETEPGTTGYAHFFEHLMFHGTPTVGRVDREQRLVEMGVEENAWTSQDETNYHLLAPSQHLDTLLELEADRFANLSLTAEGVRREAGAVYGEFRKGRADPNERLWEMLWSVAFSAHPYAHSTIGLESDIAAMPDGLERALRFRRLHYRPDNALVVVAGDVGVDTALERVEVHFGPWQAASMETRVPPAAEPTQKKARQRELAWTGPEVEPKMMIGWRAPSLLPGDAEVAAADVVVELLTARDSALYRDLVDEKDLAWRVYGTGVRNAGPGLIELGIELRKGASVDDVLTAMDTALTGVARLEDAAISAVAARMRRRMTIALADPEQRAFRIGGMVLRSDRATAYGDHVDAIQAVTAADVRAAIRRIFTAKNRTVVTVGTGDGS